MVFRAFFYDKDFFGNSDFFEQYAYAASEDTAKKYAAKCIATMRGEKKNSFTFRVERETDAEMLCVEQSWLDRENDVFRVTRVYGLQNNRDTEQTISAKALKEWIMRLYAADEKVWNEGAA